MESSSCSSMAISISSEASWIDKLKSSKIVKDFSIPTRSLFSS
jgi:hypothetical protein